MRKMLAVLALSILIPVARGDDLSAYDDEFAARDGLGGWTLFHEKYGWPDKIRRLDIDETVDGALHLAPYHSAWVRDLYAPFLFKTVQGDFDVRARLRVKAADSDVPAGTWSLGGLMMRVPNRSSAAQWQPRAENWHFITTGVGHVPGETMIETKSTFNSYSSLKLRPFASGWVELRMVRVGMVVVVLARADGEARWQVRDRFYRMENSPVAEVGLIAYTTSPDVREGPEDPVRINAEVDTEASVDMQLDVDWIRFRRPAVQVPGGWYGQVRANPLADPNLSEAELLRQLGP